MAAQDELEQLLNQSCFMPLQSPAPSKHQETQKVTLNHFYPLFFLLVLSRADLSSAPLSRQEPKGSRRAAPQKHLTTQDRHGNRWDVSSPVRGGGGVVWTRAHVAQTAPGRLCRRWSARSD